MIRVAKGAAPDVLTNDGATQTAVDQAAFVASSVLYLAGTKKFKIKRSIYAHPSVRDQLGKDQHGKCCYCEVEIQHPYMERDVEHWRPKGAVIDQPGSPKMYPGYYWLAYDWNNLFLACNVCNRLKKRSRFPLAVGSARARSHLANVAFEMPEILKPDGPDDPETHIEFVSDQPRGITPLGASTIRAVGLRRLNDKKRNEVMVKLRRARDRIRRYGSEASRCAMEIVQEERDYLVEAVLPRSPFSSIAKAFVRDNPVP